MTEERTADDTDRDAEQQRWPIGFMLLIGLTALYLGWRLIQGIGALIGWISG
ncbi:MAG: hypothetical protein U9N79_04270 [Actinomycetota bacterium]|nr:hypothetical protein [Actinomycetota bacterium]